MNFAKRAIALMLLAFMLLSTVSCGISNVFHDHTWQYHLIAVPECSEKGALEMLCTSCGEKQEVEIEKNPHSYQDGICIYCGSDVSAETRIEKVAMPKGADNSGMWSMYKIYQTACTVIDDMTYSDFTSSFAGAFLRAPSIDSLGLFHVTVSALDANGSRMEFPFALPYDAVSPENPNDSTAEILRADIIGDELLLTYRSGEQHTAGRFNSGSDAVITGIGINEEGVLVIYYSDNMIAFAGKIPD